ncbi:hypothetical protein [Spiroplasma endosymbiont of Othius punctulatus]|uniref:hypothetical protein n=1 Tax=Spiroplasma endosymbiont of Othius punctulatus TaxID=3066289 RepID=UPI0030CAB928
MLDRDLYLGQKKSIEKAQRNLENDINFIKVQKSKLKIVLQRKKEELKVIRKNLKLLKRKYRSK